MEVPTLTALVLPLVCNMYSHTWIYYTPWSVWTLSGKPWWSFCSVNT